jgi:hypothetical protein
MAMTKTQEALEALYCKLENDNLGKSKMNNIYVRFDEHYLPILDCLAVISARLDWTYCSRIEDGVLSDLEYTRDEIISYLANDDFIVETH